MQTVLSSPPSSISLSTIWKLTDSKYLHNRATANDRLTRDEFLSFAREDLENVP